MTIKENIVNGDLYEISEIVEAELKSRDPMDVLEDLIDGLREVGELFNEGQLFLTDMMASAETFQEAMTQLTPLLGDKKRESLGKIVIGTVKGDIHDIGKNIVKTMLEGNGFEVIDLGVDVPTDTFIKAIKEHSPDILVLSALLTTTMGEMKVIINGVSKSGLRDKVKIMVGGAPVSDRFERSIGADAYASNAGEAVNISKQIAKK